MQFTILDIEADGLLDTITKIHCLSYQIYENDKVIKSGTITDYQEMRTFLSKQKCVVGHSIIRYDIPAIKKILQIEVQAELIDTLGLSWYLYSFLKVHGLESWGVRLGIEKIEIDDWENLDVADYKKRCEVDVEINMRLFKTQFKYLLQLYDNNMDEVMRIIKYLNFKLECLLVQETVGIDLDYQLTARTQMDMEFLLQEKVEALMLNMPVELGKIEKSIPKVLTTKAGEISAHGEKWFNLLRERNLSYETEVVREKPNPGSHAQLKEWLFNLGWIPITFKMSKSTGKNVPQISLPFGDGLCPSVKKLYGVEPLLENLDGFYVIKHRISILKGFLETEDSNHKVYATAHGLTNTHRLAHGRPIVNLPKINKAYSENIRACLIAPAGDYVLCGADVSSLEDNTKQHYIYKYDPQYVEDMRTEGFDPHFDIGKLAGMVTKEEEIFCKVIDNKKRLKVPISFEDKSKYLEIKERRATAKNTNFCATYGGGAAKIAEVAKITLREAQKLHQIYWKRNHSIKKVAAACEVKEVRNQKWLKNPISGFWVFLKAEKDRFSTLNQNTGVYVFDTWMAYTKRLLEKIPVVMQYHDEMVVPCKIVEQEFVEKCLQRAMELTNDFLKLNVQIGISVDFGKSYKDIH